MFKCKRESKSEYFKCKCFFLFFFLRHQMEKS